MTAGDDHLLRSVTREVLAELLPGLLEEALTTPAPNGNGNGHHHATAEPAAAVPQVPAPPVAAVHRPPGWRAPEGTRQPDPPAADEQPAAAQPQPPADAAVERIDLRSDADLEAFVRSLVRRLENPRDRMAILSGRLRFGLGAGAPASAADAGSAPAMRIEKGAVTERHVREAAEKHARLVLSPRAVLTPMARDRARSLGVEIEKERRC